MAAPVHRVLWTRPAARDLEMILERIQVTDPLNARNLHKRFRKAASSLRTHPERGRIVPELSDYGITIYRELVLAPWRIVYRIQDREVYVMVVVDGRRNVEDVLLDRLARDA